MRNDYFYLGTALNSHTLCVHADMTERYHNDLLDSATIILLSGSFLTRHILVLFPFTRSHFCYIFV